MNKEDEIISRIYQVRGRKVMIDSDLAIIYDVSTSRLNQQVRRNMQRFPDDFMFQITTDEFANLMLQIATSSSSQRNQVKEIEQQSRKIFIKWGGRRKPPLVFTEHGALMLASILNSSNAINAGVYIVRAFVKMREIIAIQNELSDRIDDLERRTIEKLDEHSGQLLLVFNALRELVQEKNEPRNPVGFRIKKEKNQE
jgi:hypothetical protein